MILRFGVIVKLNDSSIWSHRQPEQKSKIRLGLKHFEFHWKQFALKIVQQQTTSKTVHLTLITKRTKNFQSRSLEKSIISTLADPHKFPPPSWKLQARQ
jgi:hypothetical protein